MAKRKKRDDRFAWDIGQECRIYRTCEHVVIVDRFIKFDARYQDDDDCYKVRTDEGVVVECFGRELEFWRGK